MKLLPTTIRPRSAGRLQRFSACNLARKKCALFVKILAAAMVVFALSPSSVFAQSGTWLNNGTNANWSETTNWASGTVPGATGVTNNTGNATFNTAVGTYGTSGSPILIDSGRNIMGISFDTNAGNYTIGTTSGNALNMTATSTIQILSTLATNNTTITINAPLLMYGGLTINNQAPNATNKFLIGGNISSATSGAKTLSINSVSASSTNINDITGLISNGAGVIAVNQSTSGGLWRLLNDANSFTGNLSVGGGTVTVSSIGDQGVASAAGAGTTINIGSSTSGATLTFTGTGQTTNRTINMAGTSGGANIFANNASGLLKFTSNFTASGAGNKTLTLRGTGAGGAEIAGSIADNSGVNITSVTKNDAAGTWTLSGNNTYSGTTTVTAGVLNIQHANALGNTSNGTTVASGAALQLQGGITVGAETLSLTANGVSTTGALRNISDSNTYGGAITLAGATRINSDAGLLTLSGGISGTQNLTIGGAGNTTISSNAIATSTGTLTKDGAGTLILSANNTYTGATSINAGTLSIAAITNGGVAGALGNSTNAAGNLALGGGTLEYTGTVNGTTDRNFTLTAGTTSGISVANSTVSLTISGAAATSTGNLTKTGAGTLILSGANAYTGATTINAGTLSIAAITNGGVAGALGNSTNAAGNLVLGGGTLEYTGSSSNSTDRNFTLTAGTTSGISVTNSTGSLTISGAAATSTGNLTKSGAGTLILSGANAYTGTTIINAGTLQIGAGSTTGSISSSSAITNNATLTVNRSDTITLSNTINGTGNLIKIGTNTLILGGSTANTYTGGTLISQGSINLGANEGLGNGFLTMGDANTTANINLNLQGRNQTITGFSIGTSASASVIQGWATGGQTGTATLTINLDSGTNSTTANTTIRDDAANQNNNGKLALVKTGSGTLDFSTYSAMDYSGGLTVNGGTLSYSNTAALGNSADGSAITFGGGTLNYTGSSSVTIANNATLTAATTSTLNNAAGNVTVSGTIGGTGSLTKSGAGNLTLSNANTYQGATNINAGTLQIGNAAALGAGGTISFGGGTLQYGAGITDDLSSRFSTAANQAYSIDTGANNIAFTSALSSSGGTLAKSGAGNLTLTVANSYTGATTVSAGGLNIQHANALGTTDGGTTVSSGAALQLQGGISIGAEPLSLTGTGVSADGALRNISGSNTYGGAITLAGATRINSDANLLTLSGGISGTQNLTIGGAGNTTISSAIATSTGTLTKDGTGTLILSANNTYSGATAVGTSGGANAGTLQLSGLGKISTAATTVFGGTLDLNGANQSITTLSLGGGASGSTAAVTTGSGTLALGGTVTFSATNNANGASISGNLDLGGATRTFTIGDSSAAVADLTVSAAISNGPLTKGGAGTLVLSGINTYTGTTTVSAGNLTISSGSAISDSGSVTLTNAAGAILHVAQSETIGNLSGGGASGGDISIASGQTLTANQSSATTFAGIISGSGGFAKNGTGTLTLSSTNTYQGATTINAGAVALTGSNTASATTINSGGTLIGTGSAGAVTVNIGGFIGAGSAAATAGTLTVGTLTLNGGSGYTWDLGNVSGTPGTNWDLVTAASTTINADSSNKFTIFITGNPTGWSPTTSYASGWNILQWGTLNSTFDANAFAVNAANFTGSAPTGSWTFQNLSGYLNLSYTAPDPAAVWNAGTGNWNTAANWQGNVVPSNNTPLEFSGAGGVSTNNGALTTISGITFTSNASGSYTLNGTALNIAGGISNLSNSTQTVAIDTTMTAAQSFNAGSANLTISGAVNNGGATLTSTGNNTVSISGAISGAGGLTKNGTGTLILSGSNSYTGTTTISAGVLNVQNANALGTTAGGTSITSGAALQLQGGITVTGETLTLNGGGVNSDGALRNISDNNEWTGNINSAFASARIASDSGLLTLSGNISHTNSANPLTFSGSGNTLVSGVMSGTGSNVYGKTGTGTLTLTGNNTFTGLLSATSGTVSISSIGNVGQASAAGAGTTINIGGTATNGILLYTGSAATSNKTINLSTGSATYSSTITQNGTGLLKFTSDFTATTGGNKTLILNGSGLGEIAGAIVNNTGNLTSLTKSGDGTWTLSGNNTYSGATTISAGTLQFAKTASLYNGTTASWTAPNIIVNSGGTLALNVGGAGEFTSANVDTIDSLGGASNGFRSNSTLALDTTNAGGTFTHLGNISNPNSGSNVLNLTKLGTGTLTLTGNNTYTGATTITAGTLQISSAGRLGGGSYSGNISNSGTFIYAGTNNQTLSGVISGSGALTQNGTGTLTLTGNNTYTGTTTIASGTLQAASAGAMGNSTVINVTGGSFLVTAADAVSDSTNINLGGGRMAMSGNFSENVGALTLSANSTIDFSGFVGTLRFSGVGSWAAGANLAIWNWSGTTQYNDPINNYQNPSRLVFTNNATLSSNLANISFYSGSGSGFIGNGFERAFIESGFTTGSEIIAVPEPETYLTGVILLLGFTIYQLRLARHGQGLLSRLTFLRQAKR